MPKPRLTKHDTITIGGVVYISLRVWARGVFGGVDHDTNDVKHVCRVARKNTKPASNGGGVVSVDVHGARTTHGGLWIIPVDTKRGVVPARGASAIKRRPDGRVRFNIWLTDAEYATLKTKHDIVDMRVVRKQRRAARKTKNGS